MGRQRPVTITSGERLLSACDLNRSTQHLISNYREGDVENEAATEDLLHRRAKIIDVGSLAERRFSPYGSYS
jgi:hypothetical protein